MIVHFISVQNNTLQETEISKSPFININLQMYLWKFEIVVGLGIYVDWCTAPTLWTILGNFGLIPSFSGSWVTAENWVFHW